MRAVRLVLLVLLAVPLAAEAHPLISRANRLDSSVAELEAPDLGLPQTPMEQALREAVDGLVAHGHAPPPRAYRARVA